MSRPINESLQLLESSLSDIKTSLESKLPSGGGIESLKVNQVAGLIDQIETGGGGPSFKDFFINNDYREIFTSEPCVVIGFFNKPDKTFTGLNVNGLTGDYIYTTKANTDSTDAYTSMIVVIVTETQAQNITVTLSTSFDYSDSDYKSDPIDVSKPGLVLVNEWTYQPG